MGFGLLFMLKRDSLPLGLRNNNAGNIKAIGNWREWQGAVSTNKGFIVFDSVENGLRAMAKILNTYKENYGISTIRDIISRYAPKEENNSLDYAIYVSRKSQIDIDKVLVQSDYVKVMDAMIFFENGQNPFSYDQLNEAVLQGFA